MKVRINGRLIRDLRVQYSYSQERLAEIAGVNLRTIQRIEAKGVTSLSTRRALAEALGVEPKGLETIRALVAISLLAAFELAILTIASRHEAHDTFLQNI